MKQKRRQNGEGTIYQRPNGLWVAEITIGYEGKKRIKKTLSSMNLEKLQKKINDTKYLNDRSLIAEPTNTTVGEWLKFWLENYKKNSVKPTTYDCYYNAYSAHLLPAFGNIKLDKLNPLMIQKYVNDKAKTHSTSSIKKIYLTLSQSYAQAVKLNMLYKNPCDSVVLPRAEKSQAKAFSKEQQKFFLAQCKDDSTYNNLYKFAFDTGMRIGELLALTWDKITDAGVTVSSNIQIVKDYDEEAEKKSKTIMTSTKRENIRIIPLTKTATAVVEAQKENNDKNSPFVFYSTTGTPLMKRNVYRDMENKFEQIEEDMSDLTFHSIRHTFATRLLEKGADIKTISQLLGHKSIQITLDIYSHVSPDLKRSTIELLE